MMVEHDIDLAWRERTVNQAGLADPARGAATARSDSEDGTADTLSAQGAASISLPAIAAW